MRPRERPAPPAWPAVAVLCLLAALSILAQGFQVPGNGNSYHWPILFGWIGSAEGPDDLFTRSLAFYVSHFWTVLALVASEDNVVWLFWLLQLAFRLLQFAALALLIRRLADCGWPAAAASGGLLGVALHWFAVSPLGHGEVMLDSLSNATASSSLVMLFFLLAVAGRWHWAALVVGIAINVSAFSFAWCALLLGLAWLAERPRDRRALPGIAALLLLPALPTIWWIAETLEATRPSLPAADFRDVLAEFYAGHIDARVASPREQGLFLLLAALGWRLLPAGDQGAAARRVRALFAGSLAIVAAGILLPALTGDRLLLNLVPLRMDYLLVLLTLALAGARLAAWWQAPSSRPLALAALAGLLSGAWLAAAALLWRPAAAAAGGRRARRGLLLLLAAAALLALWALPGATTPPARLAGGLLLAGSLLLLALTPLSLQAASELALHGLLAALHYGAVTGLLAWPLPPALAALGLWLLPPPWQRWRWPALAWLLSAAMAAECLAAGALTPRPLVLLAGGALLPALGQLCLARLPTLAPALRRAGPALLVAAALLPMAVSLAGGGRLDRYDERAVAFLALQRWAAAATPPHSLFLQPDAQLVANGTPSFWTLSRRPAWIDWRMGAAAHWLPDYYWLWHRRMAEVRALESVAAKLAYGRAQAIPYVILSSEETLPAGAPPPLYDDGFWRVLPVE